MKRRSALLYGSCGSGRTLRLHYVLVIICCCIAVVEVAVLGAGKRRKLLSDVTEMDLVAGAVQTTADTFL